MKCSGQHALPVNEVLANGLSNIEIDPSDTATRNERVGGAYRLFEWQQSPIVGLRPGGVEAVYNRLRHATSQSPPVHWESLFMATYPF